MEDAGEKPQLLFFHSIRSGRCRRVESYLAQVLQRSRNHHTFRVRPVAHESRPDLFERFRIAVPPTLIVVENRRVQARLEGVRGSKQIQDFLEPWLIHVERWPKALAEENSLPSEAA